MRTSIKNQILLSLFFISFFEFNVKSQENEMVSARYQKAVFEKVNLQKDIAFGEVVNFEGKGEKLLLDIYSPEGDRLKDRPAILWIHGGGFRPGNDKSQGYIVQLANEFAKHGYVCISINYRIRENPKDDKAGTLANALEDAMSGLNWIRKNAKELNIDKTKIFVGGGSAGGMIAVNLCYKDAADGKKWDKSGVLGLIDLWGSPDESYKTFVVDKNDPPTIIIHGTDDKLVSFENSEKLDKELTLNNVKHELIPIVGAGHTPVKEMEKIVSSISRFLFGILSGN